MSTSTILYGIAFLVVAVIIILAFLYLKAEALLDKLNNKVSQMSGNLSSLSSTLSSIKNKPPVVVQPSPKHFSTTITLVSTYSTVIPLKSENFVISASPYIAKYANVGIWFNVVKTTDLRGDSLVITTSVLLTTLSPLILSEDLKKNNVPFEGYSYIVIKTSAPITIYASFVST